MPILPWGAKPGTSGGGAVSSVSNVDGTLTISPTTGSVVASIATSAALPGSPTTTTQSAGDNSTKIATDAFVTTAVNNAIAGVNPAIAVVVATTAAANTSGLTYNNGVSGVGATFTGTINTALVIDGRTLLLGDRVLVKNDTQSPSGAFNGIYSVTTIQSIGIAPILTRSLDYDQPSDINNTGAIPVTSGTANAQTSWVQTAQITTIGTDALTFTQFTLNPTTLMTTTTYDAAAIAQQVVGTTATQTLTNKTLTTPIISSISNTGTITLPTATTTLAGLAVTETFTATQTGTLWVNTPQAISVTTNAGTADVNHQIQNFTNSSAAAMTITLTTASAVDGQMKIVRIYDFSAVAEGITWVNTENSTVTAPATSNGSTTLPLSVGFMFNGSTSKWRCLASA